MFNDDTVEYPTEAAPSAATVDDETIENHRPYTLLLKKKLISRISGPLPTNFRVGVGVVVELEEVDVPPPWIRSTCSVATSTVQ